MGFDPGACLRRVRKYLVDYLFLRLLVFSVEFTQSIGHCCDLVLTRSYVLQKALIDGLLGATFQTSKLAYQAASLVGRFPMFALASGTFPAG